MRLPQRSPFHALMNAKSPRKPRSITRSEEHTSELQSQSNLVCRLLLEKKNTMLFFGVWMVVADVSVLSALAPVGGPDEAVGLLLAAPIGVRFFSSVWRVRTDYFSTLDR